MNIGKTQYFIYLKFLFILTYFSSNLLVAQVNYPKDYFRSPLDITLKASAYFGDVRTNHYHSGLDLRTEQMEGKNVYSVAEGYVSRIRIQASGFGYAVYINHPNGFTSVYGHLQRYNPIIDTYIKQKQYEKETFEIDYYPEPSELPVRKGEIIGLSGNSGGSEGPHLHFELRDTKTEEIINPQLFGISFPDNIAPSFKKIYIYKYSDYVWRQIMEASAMGSNGKYFITTAQPLLLSGKIGIGIEASDLDNISGGPNGFYSAELLFDGKQIFFQEMDRFYFSETRYINSAIDYPKRINSGKISQRLFVLPGNQHQVFSQLPSNGIITLRDTSIHIAEIILKDISGNNSYLKIFIQGTNNKSESNYEMAEFSKVFSPFSDCVFNTENIRFTIPKGFIYDTLRFEYQNYNASNSKIYSSVHVLHNTNTPIHNYFPVSIRTNLPPELFGKAVIASLNEKNYAISAEPAIIENGFATAKIRNFGKYGVMADVTNPYITPLHFTSSANFKNASVIRFKISDNLSGIKTYRGTIDDKWVLFSLDGKTSVLTFEFNDSIEPGKHRLKMELTDRCGNTSIWQGNFTR